VRTSQQRAAAAAAQREAAAQRAAAASSAVGGAGRRVLARLRAAASADGAGQSGLAALLWTHALQAAGDALIAVALAGTVFFSVPLGQARSRVALYLVLTLLPFSLLVPVAGPLLDRFRHGRRTVLAVTSGARGLIAWSMAGALASLALYPQALAVLVLTRAYGVARNAAVVRVRPPASGWSRPTPGSTSPRRPVPPRPARWGSGSRGPSARPGPCGWPAWSCSPPRWPPCACRGTSTRPVRSRSLGRAGGWCTTPSYDGLWSRPSPYGCSRGC